MIKSADSLINAVKKGSKAIEKADKKQKPLSYSFDICHAITESGCECKPLAKFNCKGSFALTPAKIMLIMAGAATVLTCFHLCMRIHRARKTGK